MKYLSQGSVYGLVLLMVLLGPTGGTLHGDEPLEAQLLRHVAQQTGISPGRLEPESLSPLRFPLTGLTLYPVKFVDAQTGNLYDAVVDGTGNPQSLEDAQAAEAGAYDALSGRLHPSLYERLRAMSSAELLTVAIWLRAEELTPLRRPAPVHQPSVVLKKDSRPWPGSMGLARGKGSADVSAARAARVTALRATQAVRRTEIAVLQQANQAHVAAQVAALQEPLLNDLAAQGFKPAYVSPYAPLVYVEMPRSAIVDLVQRGDVDTVYGPNENRDLMNVAKPTQKANAVDAWGFDGSGVNVAILEDSRIEFGNPYLNTGTTRVPGHANVDDHATATAGMIASQHGTYQGIARGVNLFSANATDYSDSNLAAAMDWAVEQNVDIISNSYGGNVETTTLNDHDRHLDFIVRNFFKTVVVAAGNEGNDTGRVSSPARAYNVISVGNYHDRNTLTWPDDSMAPSSSFVDPITAVEKPEVAASGSLINSTFASSPWVANMGSGTSYAAPMVAGEAALLMDREVILEAWPEAVKAIVMATALHNIEGNSRLSEVDGAGGVDMRAAFRVVDEGWWHGREVGAGDFPYSYWVYVTAGETVRAAIAWDSQPDPTYSRDPLEANIDLYVYAPNGSPVTSSTSGDNSYEIVEFAASTTGYFELRIDASDFSGSTEYVGAAWWPGHRALTTHTPETLDAPPVSNDYYRFDAASCWNAVGIRPASDSDYDLYLYAGSAFGDPNAHDELASSILSASSIDLILVDGNHAASGSYYPEVQQYLGSGDYAIEWAACSDQVLTGAYGPYSMGPSQLLRVWDGYLSSTTRKYFAVKPVSGDADLVMALYDSQPGTSSTWYQNRSQSLVQADAAGAGGDEHLDFQSAVDDWMGLVVWSKGATGGSTYYLYADTTPPVGSISINSGDAYASSTSANLSLSASDAETGVDEMRFSNDGTTWAGWEPYATHKSWTLLSGDGSKMVYVQFKNRAGMISSTYHDGIILDTAPPASGATSPPSTTSLSFTLDWSGSDSVSGIATYDIQYRVGGGGTWTTWLSATVETSATFGPVYPVLVVANETYYFRVRARDQAGNLESFPEGDGDTNTSIEAGFTIYLPLTLRDP